MPVCQSVGVGGEYVGEWGCEGVSRCMWVGEGVRGWRWDRGGMEVRVGGVG